MGVVENDWRWGSSGGGQESWSRMKEEQSAVGGMSKGPVLQVVNGCDAEGGLCTNCRRDIECFSAGECPASFHLSKFSVSSLWMRWSRSLQISTFCENKWRLHQMPGCVYIFPLVSPQAFTATSGWFTSRTAHWSVTSPFSATDLETIVASSRWHLSAKSMSSGPQWLAHVTRRNGMTMCPNSTSSSLESRGKPGDRNPPGSPKQCPQVLGCM